MDTVDVDVPRTRLWPAAAASTVLALAGLAVVVLATGSSAGELAALNADAVTRGDVDTTVLASDRDALGIAARNLAALALQGPTSARLLRAASDADIDRLKYFRITSGVIGGVRVEISRTGYTGDLGYEIWIPAAHAVRVWDALMEAGRPFDIKPAGMLALDVARVEAGLLLIDVDFSSSKKALIPSHKYSPYELGLDRHPELRDDYFRHYTRVVWLVQTTDAAEQAELRTLAQEAAERIGLPLEVRHTGPGGLDRALADKGYNDPTPVQAAVLQPDAVDRDLLVSAQTGSGKTVAYGLAMASTLLGDAGPHSLLHRTDLHVRGVRTVTLARA